MYETEKLPIIKVKVAKSLIGSQPNSKKRAGIGMVICVLKIKLAALYCHASSIPLEDKADGIHTAHPSINV
jgi:hypothetical protein